MLEPMRNLLFISTMAASLGACATFDDRPLVEGPVPEPQETAIALGERVFIAPRLVATPIRVHEDSRCPIDVQCVTAGRLILETQVDAQRWTETHYFTLGEPVWLRDRWVTLVAASPDQRSGEVTPPTAYRFAFATQDPI
jgi:hypothetical protein